HRARQVVHTATADAQDFRLPRDGQVVLAVDHRLALSKPALLSAPSLVQGVKRGVRGLLREMGYDIHRTLSDTRYGKASYDTARAAAGGAGDPAAHASAPAGAARRLRRGRPADGAAHAVGRRLPRPRARPHQLPRRQRVRLAIPQPRRRGAAQVLLLPTRPGVARPAPPDRDAGRGRGLRLLDLRVPGLAAGQPRPARLGQRAVLPAAPPRLP